MQGSSLFLAQLKKERTGFPPLRDKRIFIGEIYEEKNVVERDGVFDVNAGDTVHLEFMRKTTGSQNELLTGNYTVYGISHVFQNKMLTHFICSTPFFHKAIDNFSGKSV